MRDMRRLGSAWPDDRPVVMVAKVGGALRLTATDRRALSLGLAPGLTLADARARVPDLVAAKADDEADAAFLDRLAEGCERFTPLVALDPPDGLTLDITGCAHLFGGEAALARRVCLSVKRAGLTVRAAIARVPDTARAVARFGTPQIVPDSFEEAVARRLPAAALQLEDDTLSALAGLGLRTLEQLANCPPTTLSARFGAELADRLDRVLGRRDGRIVPRRPVPEACFDCLFPEPATRADALENALSQLIGEAVQFLEGIGQGGRRFEATFFRADGDMRRITIETGRASRDKAVILRLYRTRLDSLADPIDPGFGFDAVRLTVPVTEAMGQAQADLDGHVMDDEAVADLLDKLVARFGRGRVLAFAAADTHDPDRASRLVPASRASPADAWPKPESGEPPARPIQIFDPPQPIEALAEVPDGPPLRFRWRRALHEVIHAEGPERIAPEWWRAGPPAQIRDYYRIEDRAGRRFWVFRRGDYGDAAGPPRWFLHGLFA